MGRERQPKEVRLVIAVDFGFELSAWKVWFDMESGLVATALALDVNAVFSWFSDVYEMIYHHFVATFLTCEASLVSAVVHILQ